MMRHRRKKRNRKSPSPWDRAPVAPWTNAGTSPLSQSIKLY